MHKPEKIVVQFDGRTYTWGGKGWYGPDFARPPKSIEDKLNVLAASRMAEKDDTLVDAEELLGTAKAAHLAGQRVRALDLAKRAFVLKPEAGVASTLCGFLRESNKAVEALEIANRFAGSSYPPILTTRAAALCDAGQWEEALKQIRQVLAICKSKGKPAGEALAVYARIKSDAPHLFPGK